MSSSWWQGHVAMDSSTIESVFAVEDGMAFMDAVVNEEMSEESTGKLDQVRAVMDLIPPREADFVELYFFKKLKQTDIAAIFSVSQPTVCYRLQRAASRIKYLLSLPVCVDGEVEESVRTVVSNPTDIRIMLLMYETTCQSEVAKQLGVSQGFVRHRFIRTLAKLRNEEGQGKIVALFDQVAANLNILREVQRPFQTEGLSRRLD